MDINSVSPHYKGHPKKPAAAAARAEGGAYGGFVRMSHEYSVERGSIENHRMEIERMAAARGLTLTTWYILPAISGKTIWDHPEVVRMRSDIEGGKIRGIIFTKLARLCRNTRELLAFRDFFASHGAHMVCPEVNTADIGGRLLYTLLGAIAEMERESTAERVSASIRPRAERGLNLGAAAKYGFRWIAQEGSAQPWRLEQHPGEIAVIRALLDIFFRVQSYRTAARELNELHKTRKGFAWSDSRIMEILTNPVYRGSWVRNRTTWEGARVVEKEASAWVLVPIDRVFSVPEEKRIDGIIARIQASLTRPAVIQRFLLTQIVCECGGRVYGSRRKHEDRYKCVSCPQGIPVAEMDSAILSELENIHRNDEQIALLSSQLLENVKRHEALVVEAAAARAELAGIEARMGEVTRIALELGAGVVKGESLRLTAAADALRARITELDGEAAGYVQITDVAGFLDRVAQIPAAIRNLPADKARFRLITALIPKITLGKEQIGYELNLVRNLPKFHETAVDPHGYGADSRNKGPPSYVGTRLRLDPSVFLPHIPLGNRLKWAREYLGLHQKDLARRWGKSKDSITHWEAGKPIRWPKDLAKVEKFIAQAHARLESRLAQLSGSALQGSSSPVPSSRRRGAKGRSTASPKHTRKDL